MKIICTTTFLDGRDRFEAGDVRVVDHQRGAYFIANGWAKEQAGDEAAAPAPAPGDVTLDIQNQIHGQESSHG